MSSHRPDRKRKRKSKRRSRTRVREAKEPKINFYSALVNRLTPQGKNRKMPLRDKCVIYLVIIFCLTASITAVLIWKSRTTPDLEWKDYTQLPEVVIPPACVSSGAPTDSEAYIAPFDCNSNSEYAINKIEQLLRTDSTYRHVRRDENQVQAVAITPLLGFQDDLIFQAHTNPERIEIYSRSRVGIGDIDTNRKRLEEMRELLRRIYVVK